MIEPFLTTEQVANILQVHPFTILKFLKEGKLRGIKLGRVYRIKESDVREFLEHRSTGKSKQTITREAEAAPFQHDQSETPPNQAPEPFAIEKEHRREDGSHYYII